jgi:perosamine synthetase
MMDTLAVNGGTPLRTTPFPSGKDIGEEELRLVQQVVESKLLNHVQGHMVRDFELRFAEQYGVGHCTASMSGTSAIHVAIGAINPDPCDEFIAAPITDMGTIIPILFQNCLPVFADIDPGTYNMSPASIAERITDRTRGIILVHLFGNPCDMDPIMQIARARDLFVIEDCSQAYGTMYKGRRCGTIGHFGCFSLQASKHITTGDGGLTITNDDALGERARLFADKGWPLYSADGARNYLFFGLNYHMTELTAAVGLGSCRRWTGSARRATGPGIG